MRAVVAVASILILCPAADADEPAPFPGAVSRWNGFVRHDFQVDGADVIVVEPEEPLPGRPWAWRGEFFGAFPNADIELLKGGWHLAYMSVPDLFGSPRAMRKWERLYEVLVERHGLSPRPGLIGLSRGRPLLHGLGGGPPRRDAGGLPGQRRLRLQELARRPAEGIGDRGRLARRSGRSCSTPTTSEDDREAIAYGGNPVDRLGPLAEAEIPILLVYGDSDETVPHRENSEVVYERYRALGGPVERIVKPGADHHPHGLPDPRPVVEFFDRAWQERGKPVGSP